MPGAAGASSGAPAVEGWDLPPARELFWGRQKLQRGGQTVFGDVWAGVRRFPASVANCIPCGHNTGVARCRGQEIE